MGEVWTIWVKRVLRKRKAGGKTLRQEHVAILKNRKQASCVFVGKLQEIRSERKWGWGGYRSCMTVSVSVKTSVLILNEKGNHWRVLNRSDVN